MSKILSMFIYFLRELVFDSKDEYSFINSKFNARKAVVFALILVSVGLNFYLFNKSFTIAKTTNELIHKVEELEKIADINTNKINSIKEKLKPLEKNNHSPPLNEGNNILNPKKENK